MSLRPEIGDSEQSLSHPHEPVLMEPYEEGDADPAEVYELDIWDQMNDDLQERNQQEFSYDKRHSVGNNGALQMLAVAYGEKPGHDLGDGLGSTESVEEAIDYARELGLNVVYRWDGVDEELVEDGHEIYVTNDSELAELAAEQEFTFYRDDDVYGQLMGFPEEDIEAYNDWVEIGRDFEPSEDDSINEYLDFRKDFVASKGGQDSIISHRGVVREMVKGKDYDFRDFVGAFGAFDNRVVDTEERIDEVVSSVRRLDRKIERDTGVGIVELQAGNAERQTFNQHKEHYRQQHEDTQRKPLSDILTGWFS